MQSRVVFIGRDSSFGKDSVRDASDDALEGLAAKTLKLFCADRGGSTFKESFVVD